MSGPRPLKRQRIYRACDQCRRRKSKCDGEQPACSICHEANRACTYEAGGGRRGLPSGYVRSLEIALGLIFQHAPNSQSTLRSALRDSRSQGNFLTSKHAKHSVSVWRNSKPYRDLSQLLTPGSEEDAVEESEWEPVESHDQDEPMTDPDTAPPNLEPQKAQLAPELPNPVSESHLIMNVRLPDDTSDMIDFYFTYTHCWFPILERLSVLRTMHLGNGNGTGNDNDQEELSSRILLWSLITYTSAMQGISRPGTPNLFTLQLAIEQQALTQWENIGLGHIEAILILVLLHIAMGNISQAWTLVAKAARMLATLPLLAREPRFNHTFNGCVLLDTLLSALLDRSPCFSQEDHQIYGPVEEHNLEEWDVWTPSRPAIDGEKQRMPAMPLRALSTFNHVQQLMQQLSQIFNQALNQTSLDTILNELQTKQHLISRSHPYDRQNNATPPLLILHLVSAFTTLSFCRRFEQVSSTMKDLCNHTINHLLSILDHYREITGAIGFSPLTLCFALQCQKSLHIADSPDAEVLLDRISTFLHPLKPIGVPEWENQIAHPSFLAISTESNLQPRQTIENPLPIASLPNVAELKSRQLPLFQLSSERSSVISPSAIPPSAISPSGEFPLLQPLNGTGDAEMYDALFEEMVTSFPASRYVLISIQFSDLY